MKAVLTLFNNSESFQPITRRWPVGMLPILNKPMLEWHIINCVISGIRDILILVVENPLSVSEFVGPDTRWGASIKVVACKDPCGPKEILRRISGTAPETVVIIPTETIMNIRYENLLNFHDNRQGKITRVMAGSRIELRCDGDTVTRCSSSTECEPEETGVYVSRLLDTNFPEAVDYSWNGNFTSIREPKDLWTANIASLDGCFSDFLGLADQSSKKETLQIGHHTRIDPTAIINRPSCIGDFCRVNSRAQILAYSVLGNGVIVDKAAIVRSSVIFPETYVGMDANIESSIVVANVMINIEIGTWTPVRDPFLLSGVNRKIIYALPEKVVDKILALILLLITFPIWFTKGLIRLVRKKPFFGSCQFMVRDIYFYPSSKDAAQAKNFLWFENSGPFVERLPSLINVLAGNIRLVGVRPLRDRDYKHYKEDWTLQRFEALDGLFTPVDAECSEDVLQEEKIAAENYFTATRNLKEDMRILVKAIKKLLVRQWKRV
ncbi:MAG: sugar transferase [Deltaproteobacteria bacterium]|nr:sugar transferase [Deltaproteobacteria bacterium]